MKKQIGLIGLGKMGTGLALNLKQKGWEVIVYNRTTSVASEFAKEHGVKFAANYSELVEHLTPPRTVWLMLPAGEATINAVNGPEGLRHFLKPGDHLVDGSNSYYEQTIELYESLEDSGILLNDAGVSGGPSGARNGACIMIGGRKEDFEYLAPLFRDLALPGAYKFFEGRGAGHFVKMVHNGIEYGMMQAIAEGFNLLKNGPYDLDMQDVAEIYNNGSVITSRLTNWLLQAFKTYGNELPEISSRVEHLGEGAWTVETAKKKGIPLEIIEGSLNFRKRSGENPSYTGKILTALRNQFGGHSIKN